MSILAQISVHVEWYEEKEALTEVTLACSSLLKSGFGGTAQSPLVPQIVFVLTRAWREAGPNAGQSPQVLG
jgi:hypothetical protein